MSKLNSGNNCCGLTLVRMDGLVNPFEAMYGAQVTLQEKVKALPHPLRTAKEAADNAIYWQFCIADECFELLDWLNKPLSEDRSKEMRMEAIDILHFVFNLGIELDMPANQVGQLMENFNYTTPGSLVHISSANQLLETNVNSLLQAICVCIGDLPWKHWKAYKNLPSRMAIFLPAQVKYAQVLRTTLTICVTLGMLKEDIVDYYFCKNNENHARQERGY